MPALAYAVGIVAVVLFLAISCLAPRSYGGPLGLIVGEDGRLSSSKFQFFLWTAVIVFSYVALYVADARNTRTWAVAKCPSALAPQVSSSPPATSATTPSQVGPSATTTSAGPWCPMGDLPVNVLLAMGFSLITLATAKGVTTAYANNGQIIKTTNPGRPKFSDLVAHDGSGAPDLPKVQMLVWTFIAAGTYLYAVVNTLPTFAGVPFPDISPALMVLMGLGQGAYLGNKIATSQTATISYLQPARGAASGSLVTINGSGFGASPGTIQFGDVVAAPSISSGAIQWSDSQVGFIIPPTHANGAPFVAGETVYVAVLLQGTNATSASNTVPYTF